MDENFSKVNSPGRELAHYMLKYKYWFLLSVLIFLSAAFCYEVLRKPAYTVNTIIRTGNAENENAPASVEIDKLLNSALMINKGGNEISGLSVSLGATANTLVLSYKAAKPEQARYFIDRVLIVPGNTHYTTNIINALNDSLKLLSVKLLTENKKSNVLINKIGQIKVNKTAAQPIPDKKQQDILNAITPYLKNADRQYELIPTSFPVKDPVVNNFILQFNNAQSAKQHLLSENPDKASIAAVNYKITTLKDRLQIAIGNAKASSFITKTSVPNDNSKNLLEDSISVIKTAANKDADIYARLKQKKHGYEQLIAKQEAQQYHLLSFQLTVHGPNASSIYFAALLCGLFLPFGIIGIIALFRKAKQYTNELPAEDGTLKSTDKGFVFSNADDTGMQQIAAKIKRLISERNKTILISSLSGAIDKNAICQALALYLSKKKIRVVIIDLNFDNNKSGDLFRANQPGLKDFIFNKVNKLEDIIISTPYPGISTISLGKDYLDVVSHYFGAPHIGRESIDKNQKKLIVNSPKLAFITEKLSQKFDCVLINSTALDDPAGMLPLTDLTTLNLIAIENKADTKQQMGYLQQLVAKYSINDTYAMLTD